MNAPTKAAELVQANVELLPLTSITPSETHVQAERRKKFDPQALEDLATSIRETGLLQPIVVRPLAALRGLAKYEIVAGERRWLATEKAGQAHILARIIELDDQQVLKAQLVENLHREKLDTLAEAQGYRELIDSGVNADAIAAMIGLSRSYVYARVKLLKLCPEVQEALAAGTIDASKGLLLARISSAKLQKQALKLISGMGEWYSYRRLVATLRERFMADLAKAPFSLEDGRQSILVGGTTYALEAGRGACTGCPHNSRNDAELQASLDEGAHVCTDVPCYRIKEAAHWAERRALAELQGKPVVTGAQAQQIVQRWGGLNGYVNLDEQVEDMDLPEGFTDEQADTWTPPTWRELLGEDAPTNTVLIENPHEGGKLIEAVPAADVRKAVKAAGVKLPAYVLPGDFQASDEEEAEPDDPEAAARAKAAQEREAKKREQEKVFRQRLLQEIAAKWKGPLKRDDLFAIADRLIEGQWEAEEIGEECYGRKLPPIGQMNEVELTRLLIVATAREDLNPHVTKPGRLLALAQRLKIDPKKLRASLEQPEEKPAAKKKASGKGKKK
jgi:ParB/RepB/Spo0J family partition protein